LLRAHTHTHTHTHTIEFSKIDNARYKKKFSKEIEVLKKNQEENLEMKISVKKKKKLVENSPQINDPMKKWANKLQRLFSKEKFQRAKKYMKNAHHP
jgi:hypothetical protein